MIIDSRYFAGPCQKIGEAEEEKGKDIDYLSSIEVCITFIEDEHPPLSPSPFFKGMLAQRLQI